jgi:hypothetical protein
MFGTQVGTSLRNPSGREVNPQIRMTLLRIDFDIRGFRKESSSMVGIKINGKTFGDVK